MGHMISGKGLETRECGWGTAGWIEQGTPWGVLTSHRCVRDGEWLRSNCSKEKIIVVRLYKSLYFDHKFNPLKCLLILAGNAKNVKLD